MDLGNFNTKSFAIKSCNSAIHKPACYKTRNGNGNGTKRNRIGARAQQLISEQFDFALSQCTKSGESDNLEPEVSYLAKVIKPGMETEMERNEIETVLFSFWPI